MARAGQALVEYVIVIALVAIALVTSLAYIRQSVETQVDSVPELSSCATPGQGGAQPGHGGTAPGQCKKGSTGSGKSGNQGNNGSKGSNGNNGSSGKKP